MKNNNSTKGNHEIKAEKLYCMIKLLSSPLARSDDVSATTEYRYVIHHSVFAQRLAQLHERVLIDLGDIHV